MRSHRVKSVCDGPVEGFYRNASKLEIWRQRLWWVEDIRVAAVRQEGTVQKCFVLVLDPPLEMLHRNPLPALM